MTQPSSPQHWQELLAGYALGDLSPEEAEELRRVLDTHPDLASEMHHLQEVLALMPYGLPEQNPPPHLRSAILRAAQAGRGQFANPGQSTSRRSGSRIWMGVGGAIAAIVVLALGVDNYRLRQDVQNDRDIMHSLQQPSTAIYPLKGTGEAIAASGRLLLDPQRREVVLLVQNLPQLPTDRAYRLWALTSGQTKPTYCGQFNSTKAGMAMTHWTLPEAACSTAVSQLLVTDESATAPPVPAGSLVLKSGL